MAYIQLDRKYFDNFLWNEARVYSKAEAWLDLIQMARFEASAEFVNGKMIELQRGEIPASRRFLELRWQWGSTRVSNFLKMLVSQGMINQRQVSGQTVINLINYSVYNKMQTTDKPPTNHEQTTDKPPTNQIKEYKNEKELEEDKKKNTKETFDLSFVDIAFLSIVKDFIQYRKSDLKKPFKTERGVKMFYNELLKLSGNNLQKAKQLAEYAKGKEWQTVYKQTSGQSKSDKHPITQRINNIEYEQF